MPERDDIGVVLDRLVACVHQHIGGDTGESQRAELKPDGSRVTRFDRAIERDWRRIIAEAFPDHAVLGEEFGGDLPTSGFAWALDPIDGTDDFSRGMPLYGYMIAVVSNGVPVAAATGHPSLGLHLRAAAGRGVRLNGELVRSLDAPAAADPAIAMPALDDFTRDGDCSDLILAIGRQFPNYRVYRNLFGHTSVIRGALDAALEFDVAPWDILATRLMVEEAGGRFACFRATRQGGIPKYGVVFGRTGIVNTLCGVLAGCGYGCGSADDFDAGGM